MSLPPQNPPAGWYQDPSGSLRWWDGYAWGDLAAAQPAAPAAAPSAGYVLPQPKPKPAFSKLVIVAIALTVLAAVFWLVNALTPPIWPEPCNTQECWNGVADGTIDKGRTTTPAMVLGWFVAPLLFTALGLGLGGFFRSTKRGLAALGFALPAGTMLLMILPKVLMLFGLVLWGAMGASAQAAGGTFG